MPALEQSVVFAQRRHAVLAGNIANKDVPDYRTRDLSESDFQQALRENIEANRRIGQPSSDYSPGLLLSPSQSSNSPVARQIAAEKVRDTQSQILYLDGSDVSFEHQVTEISKNALMHETAIALMRSQYQTLKTAIRETVSI